MTTEVFDPIPTMRRLDPLGEHHAAKAAAGNLDELLDARQDAYKNMLRAGRDYDPSEGPADTWLAQAAVGARAKARKDAIEGETSLEGLFDRYESQDLDIPDPKQLMGPDIDDAATDRVLAIILKYGHMLVSDFMKLHDVPITHSGLDSRQLRMAVRDLYAEFAEGWATDFISEPVYLPTPRRPELAGQAYTIYGDDPAEHENADDGLHAERKLGWMAEDDEEEPDAYRITGEAHDAHGDYHYAFVTTSRESFESILADHEARVEYLEDAQRAEVEELAEEGIEAPYYNVATDPKAWSVGPKPHHDGSPVLMEKYPQVHQVNQAGGAHRLDGPSVPVFVKTWLDGTVTITDRVPGSQYGLIPFYRVATGMERKSYLDRNVRIQWGSVNVPGAKDYEPTGNYFPTSEPVYGEDQDWEMPTLYQGLNDEQPFEVELPDQERLVARVRQVLTGLPSTEGHYIFTVEYRRAFIQSTLAGKGPADCKKAGWQGWLKAKETRYLAQWMRQLPKAKADWDTLTAWHRNVAPIHVVSLLPQSKQLVTADGGRISLEQAKAQFFRLTAEPERIEPMFAALATHFGKDGAQLVRNIRGLRNIPEPVLA